MGSRGRRFLAYAYYLKRPLRNFLPLFLGLVLLLLLGAVCFKHLYLQEDLSLARALFVTYGLVFNEHILPFPQHIVLRLFYFILPPVSLVVILDGIVQFSYYVLRRQEDHRDWNLAMAKTLHDHVILVGLGKVGFRTLQTLLDLDEQVCVLELDKDNPNVAYAHNHKVPVIFGSGREENILDDLNIASAKSIVCATDDDLINIEMALDARKAKPEIRVVLRLFDQDLAKKIRGSFDIQLAFSTSALAAPVFATGSSDRCIENAFRVGDRLMVVADLQINADSDLADRSIREVMGDHPVFILNHRRGEAETFCPDAKLKLKAGDSITLQTEPRTLHEVHRVNRDPKPW